ncbi:DUF3330 domain-containing protein, partial [Salmonella enterica subsp. enterica serovar 1,4,[5],12:i:-]|nr:DUF3330 domain-containing protein [Salmonella enterica subsp. enterica serovar 1,4,[5],12:i:-]
MGSCAAPSAKGDDKFITTDYLQQCRVCCKEIPLDAAFTPEGAEGTVAKLAMRQPFVLFKGLTFQKLCLPGAFRPGDHHNKMLRP